MASTGNRLTVQLPDDVKIEDAKIAAIKSGQSVLRWGGQVIAKAIRKSDKKGRKP